MTVLRPMMLALGVLAVLMGVLWMAQGSGYFPYPRSSFMIDQRPWITRGAILGAVGLLLIVLSRRR